MFSQLNPLKKTTVQPLKPLNQPSIVQFKPKVQKAVENMASLPGCSELIAEVCKTDLIGGSIRATPVSVGANRWYCTCMRPVRYNSMYCH